MILIAIAAVFVAVVLASLVVAGTGAAFAAFIWRRRGAISGIATYLAYFAVLILSSLIYFRQFDGAEISGAAGLGLAIIYMSIIAVLFVSFALGAGFLVS